MLKYHVLSRILEKNETNVFYSQEAKSYLVYFDLKSILK